MYLSLQGVINQILSPNGLGEKKEEEQQTPSLDQYKPSDQTKAVKQQRWRERRRERKASVVRASLTDEVRRATKSLAVFSLLSSISPQNVERLVFI